MFEQRIIDAVPSVGGKLPNGAYYASKDNEFPSADGQAKRRLNFGWVLAPVAGQDLASSGAHALPREVTFNAQTRALEQAPLTEVVQLRQAPAFNRSRFDVGGGAYELPVSASVARQSELLVNFPLPPAAALEQGSAVAFGVGISGGAPSPDLECSVTWAAPPPPAADTRRGRHANFFAARDAPGELDYYEVSASCGNTTQPLRLLRSERLLELRIFCDWTFVEVYFQKGRVVMTTPLPLGAGTALSLWRSGGEGRGEEDGVYDAPDVATAMLWPMKPIMTTPEAVRAAPRVHF